MGNIASITDNVTPSDTRTFTYDALQRLEQGGTATNPETFDYDAVGNHLITGIANQHDAANRLQEDDQFTYTYDDNGNLETKTTVGANPEMTTYHWDAQNQLIQIDFPGSGGTATYKYDGLGRRIEKNVNGTISRYVYDGDDIHLEYDGANVFVARYNHGDRTDQPLTMKHAGMGVFYYHANYQGSILNLTSNLTGDVANKYRYDSYGKISIDQEDVPQPFTYTGRELDAESGMYYYRARYYDPQAGRFISEDSVELARSDRNLYRFVLNDPINFIDPDGKNAAAAGVALGVLTAGSVVAAVLWFEDCLTKCIEEKKDCSDDRSEELKKIAECLDFCFEIFKELLDALTTFGTAGSAGSKF